MKRASIVRAVARALAPAVWLQPVLAQGSGCESPFGVQLQGLPANSLAGTSVAVGDVNFDGHTDIVIGAPQNEGGSIGTGLVRVLFGPDFTSEATLWVPGAAIGNEIGFFVLLRNVMGGVEPELIVGAPGRASEDTATPGRVLVYTLPIQPNTSPGPALVIADPDNDDRARFGHTLTTVDGVGGPQLVVGSPGVSGGDQVVGKVWVFSGLSPAGPASSFSISGPGIVGDQFGFSLADGDFNGDGVVDLAVGSPGFTPSPSDEAVRVLGGPAFGTVLFLANGVGDVHWGWSVAMGELKTASPGDELAVGAVNAGVVWCYEFGQATPFKTLPAPAAVGVPAQFGRSLAIVDLNGDGTPDLLVGAVDPGFGPQEGAIYAFLGDSCAPLERWTVIEEPGPSCALGNLGFSLAASDDLLVAGMPTYGSAGGVLVQRLPKQRFLWFAGNPAPGGRAKVGISGEPGDFYTLFVGPEVTGPVCVTLPGVCGVVRMDLAAPINIGSGPVGSGLSISFVLPNNPALSGSVVDFQAVMIPGGLSAGSPEVTDALRILI